MRQENNYLACHEYDAGETAMKSTHIEKDENRSCYNGGKEAKMPKKKKASMTLHECQGCGRRDILESGRRHWCPCNPPAPFYMDDLNTRRLVQAMIGRFTRKP